METVITPRFFCNADASRQKGDNFRMMMDRVLIGSFDITAGSQYMWAEVGGTARTMDCQQALYFSLTLISRFRAQNIAFAPLGS